MLSIDTHLLLDSYCSAAWERLSPDSSQYLKETAMLDKISRFKASKVPQRFMCASLETPTLMECLQLFTTCDFNGFTAGLSKLTEHEMPFQDKVASWRGLEAIIEGIDVCAEKGVVC